MSRYTSFVLFIFLAFATVARAQQSQRVEVRLPELPTVQGTWVVLDNSTSNGRVFDFAIAMDSYKRESRAIFVNPGDFDLFECWVGIAERPHQGRTRFIVKGDGNLLYRSEWMTWRDQAVRVSVKLKDYKGITLAAEGDGMTKFDMAIWGEPTLVQLLPPQSADDLPLPRADLMTVTRYADGAIGVMVNGENIAFGRARPVDEGGHLLVPMRPIFEALGARVSYNAAARKIIATRDGQRIILSVGSTSASINGRATSIDVPARASAGETLIPLRFVAEALGVPVEYRR